VRQRATAAAKIAKRDGVERAPSAFKAVRATTVVVEERSATTPSLRREEPREESGAKPMAAGLARKEV
jgi:hypothetical protein